MGRPTEDEVEYRNASSDQSLTDSDEAALAKHGVSFTCVLPPTMSYSPEGVVALP